MSGTTTRASAILVTGMSGTGKSTVLAELARRGHRVVDTDDPGWIVDVDTPDGAGSVGTEPMWDLGRMGALLAEPRTRHLFVAGCVANQGALYDRFDAVVLLSAPLPVVLARVADRANPYGSTPQDRERITADLAAFEPLLRAGADHEVVTTVPVAQVADRLERLLVPRTV